MFQRTTVNSNSGMGCLDFPLFIGKNSPLSAPREPPGRPVVVVLNVVEQETNYGEEPE